MKKFYIVNKDFVGARIDKWFKKFIGNIPQSLLEKALRNGKIKINEKKKKSSYRLVQNDKIIFYSFNPNIKFKKNVKTNYLPTNKETKSLSNIIIEDNENFIIINKPAGIAVQSGTKSRRNILDIFKKTKYFNDIPPYPVHRIDKETTGILIVAKNRKYAQLFTSLFRLRKIHKTYLSIVMGKFEKTKGTLVDELFHFDGKKKIKTKAITHFEVIDSNNNYSLLKLSPETGREHQLRKQLLLYNHPILGDNKYKISRDYKIKKSFLMLHAFKINFSINQKKYKFSAKIPFYFEKALNEKYLKIY